jgi:hypothetical protein
VPNQPFDKLRTERDAEYQRLHASQQAAAKYLQASGAVESLIALGQAARETPWSVYVNGAGDYVVAIWGSNNNTMNRKSREISIQADESGLLHLRNQESLAVSQEETVGYNEHEKLERLLEQRFRNGGYWSNMALVYCGRYSHYDHSMRRVYPT